jgi:hypothetical protein
MDLGPKWLASVPLFLGATIATLWMAGAIYYDVCHGGWRGALAVTAWVAAVVALFWFWQPAWRPLVAVLIVTAIFLIWWLRQQPSHDRDWEPEVAVLPRAIRAGDAITIENVRNFEYHTLKDVTPRYESRTYHLANLTSADVIFFNWGSALMSHPVLVFNFGPDGRVCMSIEVRYRKGQPYAIIPALYHQYELIFTVADERDVILRRTKCEPIQEAHLYRIITTVEDVRAAFNDYVDAINALHQQPQWYHGLCSNCTTAFYRLPSRQCRWDWRVLANARLDRALYSVGRLDRSLPFEELRSLAYLNDIANAAPQENFSDHIRRELERRRHAQ